MVKILSIFPAIIDLGLEIKRNGMAWSSFTLEIFIILLVEPGLIGNGENEAFLDNGDPVIWGNRQ